MIFNPDQVTEHTGESLFGVGKFECGECDFVVKKAEDYVKPENGNKSIKLTIELVDKKGTSKLTDCYLSEKASFKIKEFCDATGMSDKYEKGELNPTDCLGKSGEAVSQVEKGSEYMSDKTGKKERWDDKIAVKHFMSDKIEDTETIIEDDVPF